MTQTNKPTVNSRLYTVTLPADSDGNRQRCELWMPVDMAARVVREFGWSLTEVAERMRDDDDNG